MLDVSSQLRDLFRRRLGHDRATVAIRDRESRPRSHFVDSSEHGGERGAIDTYRRSTVRSIGKLEDGAMQPLVQQAVAVAVPPQHLEARGPFADEDEERARLRIFAE